MANRSQQEEIRNGRFNFNMIKLPPDRKQARHKLELHIKTLIHTYEKNNNQSITRFYIGKSSVPYNKRFDFDNPCTWEHRRIQSRWYDHKRNDYTTMVVIAVITDDTLPEGIRDMVDKAQKYCLSLESWLIDRFRFENLDYPIANDTSNAGKEAKEYDTIAYVLYVVMKLEHQPHEHVLSSRPKRRNCGKCRECLTTNCGNCSHCKDMPQFGGPGIKKQRCIMRQCSSQVQSPLESSSPQSKVIGGKLASTEAYKSDKRYTLESVSTLKNASRNHHSRSSEMVATKHPENEDSGSKTKSHQCKSLRTQGSQNSTKIKHLTEMGSRGTGDRRSMFMDYGSNTKRHQHNPNPNLHRAQESSVSHNKDVPASKFISLNGHGGHEMITDKHNSMTLCVDDGNNAEITKFEECRHKRVESSHRSLHSSSPTSTKTRQHKQKFISRRIPGNDNREMITMFMDDRERITERHQQKHSQSDKRSMEQQARMQNNIIDNERKVEAHILPKNLGRKRCSSFADMHFAESQFKRHKVDHIDSSAVVTSSHSNRAREPEDTHYACKRRSRPCLNQTKWSRGYKIPRKMDMGKRVAAHAIPNKASRQQSSRNTNMPILERRYERHKMGHTNRIVPPLQPSKSRIKSGHNSRRFQSRRHSSVTSSSKELPAKLEQSGSKSKDECIKLLRTIESMNTEELCRWFDAQSPEKRSKVKQLLKIRKPAVYDKLMARSKTNKKYS
jgi:hypothetical protein